MTNTGRTRTRPAAVVVSAVLALTALLAGCADDGGTSAAPAPTPSTSVACPPPQTTTSPGAQRTVVSGGESRTYYVWLPTGYDGTKPVPLVLDFHGAGQDAPDHVQYSPISQEAPGRGYLLVAPQGVQGDASGIGWKSPGSGTTPDDVQFVADLLTEVAKNYCVDPDRRYATGFSSGAAFTTYLGCRLDVWAAIAPLGGINLVQPCVSRPPVPVVTFHGLNDTYVPYSSDVPASLPDPNQYYLGDIETVVTQFAARNKCAPGPDDAEVVPTVMRRTYRDCAADVALYSVEGAGHTYPGGPPLPAETAEELGGQSQAIDSGKVVLDFFDAHRRTTPSVATPAPWSPSATQVPFPTPAGTVTVVATP